ncbi:hypothetical protein [Glutamicibacter sp. JC586]|nr:hypothetical protein [Glutamicibacter sp. JC586]
MAASTYWRPGSGVLLSPVFPPTVDYMAQLEDTGGNDFTQE